MKISQIVFVTIVAIWPASAWADQPGTLLHKFSAPDGAGNIDFGYGLAILGDKAFMTDQFAPGGGRVYEFDIQGNFVRTIANPGTYNNPRFGDSVAIVGNHLVVGSPYESITGANNGGPGAVFVFNATTGALERRINAPSSSWQVFGQAVYGSGNLLAIGADHKDISLYDINSGQVIRTFHDPSTESSDLFGASVLIYNNTLFISAPQDSGHHTSGNMGVIYGFDITTGALQRVYGDHYNNSPWLMGLTMDIVNGHLLVGGPKSQVGAAYEFDINTGSLLYEMHQPAGTGNASYGTDVAGLGQYEVVGMARFQNPGGAFLYHNGVLLETFTTPNDGSTHDFGQTLTAWGNNLLIGDVDADGRGAAYLYSVVPEPSAGVLMILGAGLLMSRCGIARLRKGPDGSI